MFLRIFTALLSLTATASVFQFGLSSAASAEDSLLEQKATFLCETVLTNSPFVYEDHFAASFRKAVPESSLLSIAKTLSDSTGICKSFESLSDDPKRGNMKFYSDSNRRITIKLTIEQSGLIAGFLLVGVEYPDIEIESWEDVQQEMAELPGDKALSIKNFDRDLELGVDERKAMPTGSIFKIYVLGTLADKIKKGELNWNDKLAINPAWKSLPSGQMQNWENGTEVTLQEYAEYMVKISDNTATDHLLYFLGRNSVEQQLITMKNSHLNLNTPMLGTLELFKLKWGASEDIIANYLQGDSQTKRNIISKELTPMPTSQVGTNDNSLFEPTLVNELEWFASTSSSCDGMNALKDKQSKEVMKALSFNTPSIDIQKSDKWKYAGYKGGSEPGVFAMSYLLQSKSGDWGCVSFATSNESSTLDEIYLAALVAKILNFAHTQMK